MRQIREYALYKGEKFLMIGNYKEIASYLNIKPESASFLGSPAYHKRKENSKNSLIAYSLEEKNA